MFWTERGGGGGAGQRGCWGDGAALSPSPRPPKKETNLALVVTRLLHNDPINKCVCVARFALRLFSTPICHCAYTQTKHTHTPFLLLYTHTHLHAHTTYTPPDIHALFQRLSNEARVASSEMWRTWKRMEPLLPHPPPPCSPLRPSSISAQPSRAKSAQSRSLSPPVPVGRLPAGQRSVQAAWGALLEDGDGGRGAALLVHGQTRSCRLPEKATARREGREKPDDQ